MTLVQRIDEDLKAAMKARDEAGLSVLRMMRTALKNKQIDLMHELSEEEVQAVIKTMVKQGKDALSDFELGGRQDLVDKQKMELDFLQKYLPEAMGEEELQKICEQAVKDSGAAGPKDMGKAMGMAMKIAAGRADGNAIKAVIEKMLGSMST